MLQMVPFPDRTLSLAGKPLDEQGTMAACGITDGCTIDLHVAASEETLIEQLKGLLRARELTCDELGLLYCYKYGASVTQSLKLLGFAGKLPDFLKSQKGVFFENGRVALVREDTALKPCSVAKEVMQILQGSGGSMETRELSARFVQKFNVSIASLVNMRPAEFFAREPDLVVSGNTISLRAKAWSSSCVKRCVSPDTAGAAPLASLAAKDAAPLRPPASLLDDSVGCEQYMELHDRISSRSFCSRAAQSLQRLCDQLADIAFLRVEHVAKGGSVGKGVAITGSADAEVVVFVRGLPPSGHDSWLPPLLRSVAAVLSAECKVLQDSLQVDVHGSCFELRFSPAFGGYRDTLTALAEHGPEARKHFSCSLIKERVQFIAKQPSSVKATIRLLKWWRDQQEWSSRLLRPSDEIVELTAVYSAVQTKPSDQRAAIANVMNLFCRFADIRVLWSNFYSKEDVWAPLLQQRPLLMDPTNPFVNVADPQLFDSRELMEAASTTHFFY